MKKISKVFVVFLLLFGSFGVCLQSSHFINTAIAASSYTLNDGYTEPGGSTKATIHGEIKKIKCTGRTISGVHYLQLVVSDSVDDDLDIFYKGGDTSNSAQLCNDYVSGVINNAKSQGITVDFSTSDVTVKTEGGYTFAEWSKGAGSGNGYSGGGTGGAPTMNILPCELGEDGGENVKCVLKLVVNIMTYGIGILGTIGVVITGIQYISSQGDPAKMTKAKSRLIQIIIGLVVYAVMFAALKFLVPGFNDLGGI